MNVTAPLSEHASCAPVSEILSRIGEKWTVFVVMVLHGQPRRFNEIKRQVGGISQQMLTRTLKALERDGLVTRTVHRTMPPQVEYALTELGQSLSVPILQLGNWAQRHIKVIHSNRAQYDACLQAAMEAEQKDDKQEG
ncbi:transcriptional regulator [Pseudomonas fluorescens]|uniref:Transcriptional regulator n=1 Tax=Pseudomonas fluorescens TaxID=294 RepID=A0A379IE21_PSEFL|nr:helix-turn-helix domain-containing protein [Pseudomonas fluorescens]AIG01289.1 HxlR family transcriptional regulator [Pseudomonas fluorescens]SUD31042.1 transcriptional regulator [Pseudomonas fluorescens]